MSDKEMLDVTAEIAKEIAKDAYDDVGKPVMKPTGELVGLIPRTIKAVLSSLEKWVLQREYNVAETRKLLEEKLKNIPPELIESPEPHIAVPAMQYISYCMDKEELRDMYANLLANSMNAVVKNGVHPGFVEIIKQLSPDEAKILRVLERENTIPTISLKYSHKSSGGGVEIIRNFSTIGEQADCERPYDVNMYFDNLVRLGLLYDATGNSHLTDKTFYEPLKKHRMVAPYANNERAIARGYDEYIFSESLVRLTAYGQSFCEICLNTREITSHI